MTRPETILLLWAIGATLATVAACIGIGLARQRLAIARRQRTEARTERDEARQALAETTDVLVARDGTIRRLGVELAKADTTIREYEDRVNRQRERLRKARTADDEAIALTRPATPLATTLLAKQFADDVEAFVRKAGETR